MAQRILPDMYKTAAFQKMLVGQTKVNYDFWKSEGWIHSMLVGKFKEYTRRKKLDKEANQGKQAVDLRTTDGEPDAERWSAHDESGDLNALAILK